MEAQNRESQMIEMSQWMTEVTQLLQSRLDADILAGDMPKEFEVSNAYKYTSYIKNYMVVEGFCCLNQNVLG